MGRAGSSSDELARGRFAARELEMGGEEEALVRGEEL